MGGHYRVSGPLAWIAGKVGLKTACVIGCVSPEPRTLSAVHQLDRLGLVGDLRMLDLANRFPSRFAEEFERAKTTRWDELKTLRIPFLRHQLDLLNNVVQIRDLARDVAGSYETVIIDISTMPKRAFFPLLKFLRQSADGKIRTLLATYTSPVAYPPVSEPLVEQLMPMAPLPGFNPDVTEGSASTSKIIVGLGFEIGTLPEFLSSNYLQTDLKILFPIPPGPPYIHRNHELLRQLRVAVGREDVDVRLVSSLEVSETYDIICGEASAGPFDLAPYGPKPLSLGMCLAAIKYDAAVYYAQPQSYNPRYSIGGSFDSDVEVTAYPIRVNGVDWY